MTDFFEKTLSPTGMRLRGYQHAGELIVNQVLDDYLAVPAASHSMLSHLKRSPAHLQWALRNPTASTIAMRLGSALHACVLEGPKFLEHWVCGSELDGRSREGKIAKAELEEQFDADKILKVADYNNVIGMAGAVFSHPITDALITDAKIEISAYWKDQNSSKNTKGRIDILPPSDAQFGDVLCDLKTTTDASPEAFAKTVASLGYHRQAALYLRPFENRTRFLIIAVEKTPPWAVAVYELSPNAIARGWQEVQKLLMLWAQCQEDYGEDLWPSYPDEIQSLDLPAWAY
tara:strand:+ start:1506 stop:2372 length:867 start_codon:yes stop_codon:yes gene_type:complete